MDIVLMEQIEVGSMIWIVVRGSMMVDMVDMVVEVVDKEGVRRQVWIH